MRSLWMLGGGLGAVVALAMGCGGSDGKDGTPGAQGAAGQNGTNGTNGTNGNNGNTSPSVSAMIPRIGVLDRELDAVIIGNETAFDNTTQIDLGSGVTISNLQVASPTALFAHLKIDKAATTGLHDLKVTGASAATVTGMFNVLPAMGITVSAGTATQGGLAQIDLTDNDSTGFATNVGSTVFQLQGGLFTFQNFLGGSVIYQTPGAARYIVAFDPLATAGATQPIGVNAYYDQSSGAYASLATFYSDPAALTVAAASPETITVGTPIANENLDEPLADRFYHLTTNGSAQITQVTFTLTSGSGLQPFIWAIPHSGKFGDVLFPVGGNPAIINLPSGAVANDYFLVMMDQQFRGGAAPAYAYSVTSAEVAANAVTEQGTAHGTVGTAQGIATATPTVLTGAISGTETDVYSLGNLPSTAGFCNSQFNTVIIAQSDVCVILDLTTNLDADVSNANQYHACYFSNNGFGVQLGTGGQRGLTTSFCSAPTGDTWGIAVFPRYQAQVATGPYTVAYGY
jgi:hypothetical protein